MFTIKTSEFDIRKIAESGQVFRLQETAPDVWRILAFGRSLVINESGPSEYQFECTETEFHDIWYDYFDMGSDYSIWREAVPSEDVFLKKAVEFGKGIRILRQDPWEMLITFIISQRKNIPAIRHCVEALCIEFGEEINDSGLRAFPSAEVLAGLNEQDFCNCSLGYRLPYIRGAAKVVASGQLNLKTIASLNPYELPDSELMESLLAVPGVGPKVARCVMLFGFHRLEAFPIDVWIERVIREHYSGNFPVELYAGFAGVIQQYIFYYARRGEKV